jgi:hypothetical protein
MPLLPFSAWTPDTSDYDQTTVPFLANVLPRGDGYGPMQSFSLFSAPLAGPCRGFFKAIRSDGSIAIFAGTASRLYLLNNTNATWTDVSKGGVAYAILLAPDNWQFVQFNNFVIAVQANVPPQVFDLTSSTAFADLGGSPPQARYISVVGRFLVLSGLLSNPYRIQWSGLNATTTWTSGVNSSDFQDLPDGGIVRGVAGGEFGNIFQDTTIRRMTYAPGSPVIFQIERITEDRGLLAPYSLTRSGDQIFFLSAAGFMQMSPAGYPAPVGKEKIDRTLLADLDKSNLQLCIGAPDPQNNRIFLAYKSVNGAGGLIDKIICYDYVLQRFSPVSFSGEYLGTMAQPGLTLEALDAINPNIDTFPGSFDNIAIGSTPEIAAFDASHRLGFFRGPNLEAQIETGAQSLDKSRRVLVTGFRPITDAATVYGSVGKRERWDAAEVLTPETQMNAQGIVPQRASTRFARGKIRIPAGTNWAFAEGIEPEFTLEGLR